MSRPLTVAHFCDHYFHRIPLGLSRYTRELDAGLRELGVQVRPCGTWSNMEPADLAAFCARTGGVVLPGGRRSWIARWTLLGRPLLERRLAGDVDLVHITSPGYPTPTKKPCVVTIHDIGLWTHPEFFAKSYPWAFRAQIREILRRDDRIIAVSSYTASEWRQRVSKTSRVEVIPEGVADVFRAPADSAAISALRARHGLDRPFFLAAGSLNPRKNVVRLVQAFSALLDTLPHDLVLVGSRGWDDAEIWGSMTDPRVRDRVRFLGFVDDPDLNILYREATAFVMVSLFEGFGLPAAEAMAGGCPVIAANTTSLPEVVGDGGLLVDPLDVSAIGAAMRSMAEDPGRRAELAGRALEHVRRFDWARAARTTLELYQDMVARA